MPGLLRFLIVAWLAIGSAFGFVQSRDAANESYPAVIAAHQLPREAQETLLAIKRGGPFPYSRDGIVFGNFEKRLPSRRRGYYREYTVPTPGAHNRGARRIVIGENGEYFYSDDHYRSFRRIQE